MVGWILFFVGVFLLISIGIIIAVFLLGKKEESNCFIHSCPEGQKCSGSGNCIDENTCENSTDCLSGNCQDGLCVPSETKILQTCQTSGDCSTPGYRCQEGICVNNCSSSGECLGSQACINNVCQPKPCLDSTDCLPGEGCSPFILGNKVCVGGEDCTLRCPESMLCVNGKCRQCTKENKKNCPSRVCSEGACFPCDINHPCEEGKVCNLSGNCCPETSFASVCKVSSDCPKENPYCLSTPSGSYCSCTLLGTGQPCKNNTSCANGSCRDGFCTTTPCANNAVCPLDKPYCSYGQCSKDIVGSPCVLGGNCNKQGFYCVEGVCSEKPGGYGTICTRNDDCLPEFVCQKQGEKNYCLPKT